MYFFIIPPTNEIRIVELEYNWSRQASGQAGGQMGGLSEQIGRQIGRWSVCLSS